MNDQIKNYYSQNIVFARPASFEKIKRLLNLDSSKKLKVLDIGCGDGRVSEELVKLGHEVWGLDASEQAAHLAQEKGIKVIIGEIEKFEPDQKFDLIIMTDILEHLFDPLEMLVRAKSWLSPDGEIIINFPNHFDLRNRLQILFGESMTHWSHKNTPHKSPPWLYSHIRFLTLSEVRAMIKQSGLFIVKEQFNFMAGGIVPTRLTPSFFRKFLVKTWPNLFSGKFTFLLKTKPEKIERIYLAKTIKGM